MGINKKLFTAGEAPLVPSENFNTVLYTGNQTARSITGFDFTPDLVWIKSRNETNLHVLTDSVRGTNKQLFSNQADAESTSTDRLTAFNANGFSIAAGSSFYRVNKNSINYAAWSWKAGGSSNTFNKNGTGYSTASAAGLTGESNVTIQGSSVNTETGISIIKTLAGSGSGETIPHGLGTQPELIISKPLNAVLGWYTWTPVINNGSTSSYTGWDFLFLNTTAAAAASTFVYASNTHIYDDWASGRLMVYYSFVSIAGYSKIGSYSGSNSPLTIYTTDDGTSGGANGFEPAFVMFKRTNASGSWIILDDKRTVSNGDALFPDSDSAESLSWNTAFISNGFTISSNEAWISEAGGEYIFMAFSA